MSITSSTSPASSTPAKVADATAPSPTDADANAVQLTQVTIYANVQRPQTLAVLEAVSAAAFATTSGDARRPTQVTIVTPQEAAVRLRGAAAAAATPPALPFLRLWEQEGRDVLAMVANDTPLLQQMEFYLVESGGAAGRDVTLHTDAEVSYAVHRRQMPTLCLLHRRDEEEAAAPAGRRGNRTAIEALLYRELRLPESDPAAADACLTRELAERLFWFPRQMGRMAAVESNLFVRDLTPGDGEPPPTHRSPRGRPAAAPQLLHGEFYMKCVRSLLSLFHKHRHSGVVCVRGDGCPFFPRRCDGEAEGHVHPADDPATDARSAACAGAPTTGTESPIQTTTVVAEAEEFLPMPPTKFNTLLYQNIIDRMTTSTATTGTEQKDGDEAEAAEKDPATREAEAIIRNTLASIELHSKRPQLCGSFFPLNRYENRHVLRYMLLKGYTVIAIDHFTSMARELAHTVSLRNFDTSLLSSALLTGKAAAAARSPTTLAPVAGPEREASCCSSSSNSTAVSMTARERGTPPPPRESDNMRNYRQFCTTENLNSLFVSATTASGPNGSLASSTASGGGAAGDPLRILAFYMNLRKPDVDVYIQCIQMVQALERQWLRLPQPQHHLILQQPSHSGSAATNTATMSNYLSPVMNSGSTHYHASLSFSSISSCGNLVGIPAAAGNPLTLSPPWLHINPSLMLRQFASLWLSCLLDVHDPKTGLVRLCEAALEDPQLVVLRHQRDAFAVAPVAAPTPLEPATATTETMATGEERSAAELDAIFDDWMLRVLKQKAK
ncbi:hypothetical protein STCU_11718 [Strigomonas culicis]|uniref:Uncharacterized protein n=1 Tax=Strigomonas culicis TaxID=28005 RepID=S9UZ65_9TRYP|nr:hypothetical protein STCU_11718 [Strigomonas culicis]|eukprot:EPY15850.1 hypothetical protein STCU_11718 [Strigomonas culicis]